MSVDKKVTMEKAEGLSLSTYDEKTMNTCFAIILATMMDESIYLKVASFIDKYEFFDEEHRKTTNIPDSVLHELNVYAVSWLKIFYGVMILDIDNWRRRCFKDSDIDFEFTNQLRPHFEKYMKTMLEPAEMESGYWSVVDLVLGSSPNIPSYTRDDGQITSIECDIIHSFAMLGEKIGIPNFIKETGINIGTFNKNLERFLLMGEGDDSYFNDLKKRGFIVDFDYTLFI